jgi:hypothetical protein
MDKTKETLPKPPFDMYRYLDDDTLIKGVVEKIFFLEDSCLVGIPNIRYDESSCTRPLTPIERCTTPYAVNLCLTPEEARCSRLNNHKMMLEIYEKNKVRCVESFLSEYDRVMHNIQKTKLQILKLEEQQNEANV